MIRVAVVGGGISGLSAAYRLRELLGAGVELTVLEQSGRLGGKLRTIELAGGPYDVGAEAFLARRPEVRSIATRLGIAEDIVHPEPVRATIRAGGRSNPIPAGTVMGVPASAGAVADVLPPDALRRVACEPDQPPLRWRRGGAGNDLAVGDLLRQRFGTEVAERLVDPLLGGVYAGRADALGVRATMPALAAALDAGETSLLRAAASLLPAAGGDAGPVFGAFRGGYRQLVDRLVASSGARVRTGLPVHSLRRHGSRWQLEIGAAPGPGSWTADAVVLAVPAPAAAKLLTGVAPAAAAAYARIELASMAVVAMALPLSVTLPAASGVLLASGERHAHGEPFTAKALTYSSRKWQHLAGERVLVRGSVGKYGEASVLRRSDAELLRAVRADLAELTGITAAPVASAVLRWGGGLPQYGVGHLDTVAEIEQAVSAVPGLAVAGASLHGVGVPACVATGWAAAERLARYL
ncbi:MAG: protoporphyrinogen oxidase [Sciscionella sp.]